MSSTDGRPDARRHAFRLAAVALLCAVVTSLVPGAILAADAQIRLSLLPVGQPGPYFDLVLRPGESRTVAVEIGNAGDAAITARTYAADVYTITNGGFGGRLRDEPQTGATRWLSYPTDVLELGVGSRTRRSVEITVPRGTGPGEYITSLVLENDQPIAEGGPVALAQIVRQAIAVVVTVPGRRTPALAIDEATHSVVGGRSVVSVAVRNIGNVRLEPVARLSLFDAHGALLSKATVQVGTFYAATGALIEVPLAALLEPGIYSVDVTMDDAGQGATTERSGLTFVVTSPTADTATGGLLPGLTVAIENAGDGQISLPVWAFVVLAGLLTTAGLGWLIGARRQRRTTGIS